MPLGEYDRAHFSNQPGKYKKLIYIMSYPRSGNAWCRYILENLTRFKSFGYAGYEELMQTVQSRMKLVDSTPMCEQVDGGWDDSGVIRKRHWWEQFDFPETPRENQSTILLLRNPPDLAARGAMKSDSKNYSMYIDLVDKWMSHEGRKLAMTYDCLVSNPVAAMQAASVFLQMGSLGKQRTNSFSQNLKTHVQKSRAGAAESKHAAVDSSISDRGWGENQIKEVWDSLSSVTGTENSIEDIIKFLKQHFKEPEGRQKIRNVPAGGGYGVPAKIVSLT